VYVWMCTSVQRSAHSCERIKGLERNDSNEQADEASTERTNKKGRKRKKKVKTRQQEIVASSSSSSPLQNGHI
jgi:hypothetical protein